VTEPVRIRRNPSAHDHSKDEEGSTLRPKVLYLPEETYGSVVTSSLEETALNQIRSQIDEEFNERGATSTRFSNLDNLDATISSRATPADSPDPAAYTPERAAKLDNLDKAITAVDTEVDESLNKAIPDAPTPDSIYERIKTLDDNYTPTRAAKLDNLDASVSSVSNKIDENASDLREKSYPVFVDDFEYYASSKSAALHFPKSAYVEVPNSESLNPTRAIAIEVIIKPVDWNGNRRIVQKGLGDNQYRLLAEGGALKFHLYGVTNGELTCPLPTTGEKHYILAQYDSETGVMEIYVDNVLAAQRDDASGTIATTSDPLYIGHKSPSSPEGDSFYGDMDELRMYRRTLTEEERTYNYNNGEGRFVPKNTEGLILWMHFDEGSGNTVRDSSPCGNDGTMNGASWIDGYVEPESPLKWDVISGTWATRNSVYTQEATETQAISLIKDKYLTPSGKLSDFIAEMRIKANPVTYHHTKILIFYYQDERNYYYVVLGEYYGPLIQIRRAHDGLDDLLAETRYDWDSSKWYLVKIRVKREPDSDMRVTVWINGSEVLEWKGAPAWQEGRVGIGSSEAPNAYWDWVRITPRANPLFLLEQRRMDEHHETRVFPENTDETVTLTAGSTGNEFGPWTEIADNNGVTFSSKFSNRSGYIEEIIVEGADQTDNRYLLEIGYRKFDTDYIVIARVRFVLGSTMPSSGLQTKVHGAKIPAGATVVYRMKCETANATSAIQIRYYLE